MCCKYSSVHTVKHQSGSLLPQVSRVKVPRIAAQKVQSDDKQGTPIDPSTLNRHAGRVSRNRRFSLSLVIIDFLILCTER